MNIISSDEYNDLILRYTANNALEILLKPLGKGKCSANILQVIKNDLYIQNAVCRCIITEREQISLDIPRELFRPENYLAVFGDVNLLSEYCGNYSLKLGGMNKETAEILSGDYNISMLHPLIGKSLAYYRDYGAVDFNAKTVFMRCTLDGTDISDKCADLFVEALNSCGRTGYINIAAYMTQTELIASRLLPVYKNYFDELVAVGYICNNEFVSHSIIGFYNKG